MAHTPPPQREGADEFAHRLGLIPTRPQPAPPPPRPPTPAPPIDSTQPIRIGRNTPDPRRQAPSPARAPSTGRPPVPSRTESVQPAPGRLVRLNIATVNGDIDLAVPDSFTVAALLSAVLRGAPALAEQGRGRGGWLLALAGQPPLRGEQSLAELRMLDGTTLMMTGVYDHPPQARFDDLADAVARAASRGVAGWRSGPRQVSALVGAGLLGVAAAAAALGSRSSAHGWAATTAATAVAALALLVGAGFTAAASAIRRPEPPWPCWRASRQPSARRRRPRASDASSISRPPSSAPGSPRSPSSPRSR